MLVPDIHVKAGHKNQHSSQGISNSYHYNHEQLKQQGANSLTTFFQQQGIMQVGNQSSVANQSGLDLHGFGVNASQNTLLMVDGIPFASAEIAGPTLDSMLTDNIANITIIPGSHGALYGNQAIGGVVNITTRSPQKFKADAMLGLGNKNQQLVSGFVSERLPSHLGYSLGVLASHTAGFGPSQRQNNYLANGKVDYIGEQGSLSLNFLAYRNQVKIANGQTYGKPEVDPTSGYFIDNEGSLFYILSKRFLSKNWQWLSNLSTINNNRRAVTFLQTLADQQSWRWQNQWHYRRHFLFGADLIGDRYNIFNSKKDSTVHSFEWDIYLHNKLAIAKHWNFILGSRYARRNDKVLFRTSPINSQVHDDAWVSEQGLEWQPQQNLNVYLRHDTNFRFPKSDERIWIPASVTELKTQKGKAYETGVSWKPGQSVVKLSLYRLDLTNELAFDPTPTPDWLFGSVRNLPPTRRRGVDASLRAPLRNNITALLQMGLVDPKISSGPYQGKRIPMTSPFHGSAALLYKDNNGWSGSVTETYHSSFYASNDLANVGAKFHDYFLTNLYLHKAMNGCGVGLQVNNLFDKRYARFASFRESPFDQSRTTTYYPSDGTSILATVDISVV